MKGLHYVKKPVPKYSSGTGGEELAKPGC